MGINKTPEAAVEAPEAETSPVADALPEAEDPSSKTQKTIPSLRELWLCKSKLPTLSTAKYVLHIEAGSPYVERTIQVQVIKLNCCLQSQDCYRDEYGNVIFTYKNSELVKV